MTYFMGSATGPTAGVFSTMRHWYRDPRLTLKAKGLMAFLCSHEGTYECSVEQMVAETKESYDAVYAALKELLTLGYLERETLRDERGRTVKGGSVYSWGPAAFEQQYVRNWGPKRQASPQVNTESGKSRDGDDAASGSEDPQVATVSGKSRSGKARSGKAGSGQAGSGEPAHKEVQLQEEEQPSKKDSSDQPSVDRPVDESSRHDSDETSTESAVQPALDGSVPAPPPPDPKAEARGLARKVARAWIAWRADQGVPIVVSSRSGPEPVLAKLLEPYFESGYTEDEVKRALNGLQLGIPSHAHMQSALAEIRGKPRPAGNGAGRVRQRPAGLDVNQMWAGVTGDTATATAASGGVSW